MGNPVMAYLRKERFLVGTHNKLSQRWFGPFQILKRLGPNAYLLELPDGMPTTPMFNDVTLFPFYSDPLEPPEVTPLPLTGLPRLNDDLIESGTSGPFEPDVVSF